MDVKLTVTVSQTWLEAREYVLAVYDLLLTLEHRLDVDCDLRTGLAGGGVDVHGKDSPAAVVVVIVSEGFLGECLQVDATSVGVEWDEVVGADNHVFVGVGVELVVVAERVVELALTSVLVALLGLDLGLREV
jgi:hypothetical protein